jgi:hypothetical protein
MSETPQSIAERELTTHIGCPEFPFVNDIERSTSNTVGNGIQP